MYYGPTTFAGPIEVSVKVNGFKQPIYRRSDGALFVAGKPGQVYTLGVRNMSYGRIEVINTVDGRNTLKDEPGDYNKNTGLVFASNSSGAFTGWRVNNDTTREFVFGSPAESVAAQATGSTSNVGVIGFAAWREQPPVVTSVFTTTDTQTWPTPRGGGFSSISTPIASASAMPEVTTHNLGTGIGKRQDDHVGTTSFKRQFGVPSIIVIHYDTHEALVSMGIIPEGHAIASGGPSAFPGSDTGYQNYV